MNIFEAIDNIVFHLAEVDSEYLSEKYNAIVGRELKEGDDEDEALNEIREILNEWDEDGLSELYSDLFNKEISIS